MRRKRRKPATRSRKRPGSPKTEATAGKPIPHCNTYGQWVADMQRTMDDTKRRT